MVVSVMMNKGVTNAGPLVQQAERLAELFARRLKSPGLSPD